MTNEKAKEILEEVKILDDSMYQYNKTYLQALDMAIEALEQEPVLDKIRAEIKDYETELFNSTNLSYMSYGAVKHCLNIIDRYRKEQIDADSD